MARPNEYIKFWLPIWLLALIVGLLLRVSSDVETIIAHFPTTPDTRRDR
jgi:hypothetical protein